MSRPLRPSIWAYLVVPAILAFATLQPASAGTACGPGALFYPAQFYDTADYPFCPVSADFNHDGITDIAVTCYFSNAVSILFGMGDGSFSSPAVYPAGTNARSMACADLDGDGILDFAVTNVGPSTVSILKGLGDGGVGNGMFAPPVAYPAGQENRGIVITDVNGDGHPDLIVAGLTSVAVLFNRNPGTGWGSFTAPTLYPMPWAWGVTVGDYNGDGKLDIAAANFSTPEVDILLGVGDGTFTAGAKIPTPGPCSDITTRDLDGDGILDLVVPGRGGIWVLRGNGSAGHGDGTFALTAYAQIGHTFNGLLFDDFNHDGKPDIVATDTDGITAVVLPGLGGGLFGAMDAYPVGTGPIGMVAFDANQDGIEDLIVACSSSAGFPGSMAVLLGKCTSNTDPTITAVRDVKHDQGGRVVVTWLPSSYDSRTFHAITRYRVWRRAVPAGAQTGVVGDLSAFDGTRNDLLERRVARPDGAQDVSYWESLAEVPAAFLEGYAYTAATLQDSVAGSNPYTAFFIQALTSDPTVFYVSPVDSGYSVDDLAPPEPAPFTALYTGGAVALHWGVSPAADLFGYRLYRGPSPDFEPGPGNLVVARPDTGYVDHPGNVGDCYKLSAVDVHGNESHFALVTPSGPTSTLASLVSAVWRDGAVRLVWAAPANPGLIATLYRSVGGAPWQSLGPVAADGTGTLRYDDTEIVASTRYGYRLGITDGEQEVFAGETYVDVPALEFALHAVRPNPAAGEFAVAFSLPDGSPARVEVLDLAGRRMVRRDVGALGAGSHVLNLTETRALPAGVYLVRLIQGRRTLMTRATVIH